MARQQKWNLKEGVAEFEWLTFRLRIDAAKPDLGGQVFFGQAASQAAADASLFQVGAPSSDSQNAVETYCRGRDLISRYVAGSDDPITRELYWRLVDGEDEISDQVVSVETIYSLQTDLLDSVPQPSVPSVFGGASNRWFLAHDSVDGDGDAQWNECSWEDACFAAGEEGSRVACVISLENGSSVLQTVYPPDLRGVEMNVADEQTEIHWQLRSDFLEKGVIRRLRLLTVLGSSDSGEKDLLEAASLFYHSELPLTV